MFTSQIRRKLAAVLIVGGLLVPSFISAQCYILQDSSCEECLSQFIVPGSVLCGPTGVLYECSQISCVNSECPCDGTIDYLDAEVNYVLMNYVGGYKFWMDLPDQRIICARVRPCLTECEGVAKCLPLTDANGHDVVNNWECAKYKVFGTCTF